MINLLSEERRKEIEDLVNLEGSVKIDDLVDKYNLTRMTIWRDLKHLADKNLIKKIHGGAVRIDKYADFDLDLSLKSKKVKNTLQKQIIARYAALNFVKNNDLLFFDSGTTVSEMIPHLNQENLTIITNGVETLLNASKYIPPFTVFSCGGMLKEDSLSFVGKETSDYLSKYNASSYFFSVPGVSLTQGVCETDPLEYAVKQTMFQQAEKRILLVDSSKFGKKYPFKIATFEEIDCIITDEYLPSDIQEKLINIGVSVEIATIKWFHESRKNEIKHVSKKKVKIKNKKRGEM
ncbi:MAG: DeoR/GlpR family DNA-binding transcription regulator [Promethearchaeota archaeon]